MQPFTVTRTDRWHIRCFEGSRTVTIPVEASADGSILGVYLDRADRWDPPDNSILTPAERALLQSRIVAEMRQHDVAVEFDAAS